jgi:hypothetical protein
MRPQYCPKEKGKEGMSQLPVAHVCNPNLGDYEIGRIGVLGQPRQRVQDIPSPK